MILVTNVAKAGVIKELYIKGSSGHWQTLLDMNFLSKPLLVMVQRQFLRKSFHQIGHFYKLMKGLIFDHKFVDCFFCFLIDTL
jgi:hypothetical protein